MSKWISIKKKPKKEGMYLVCAPSLDPKRPLRHMAFYDKKDGWWGLVPIWLEALTHYMPFPKTPHEK